MALMVIVGAGRVGSQVARSMLAAGHEVSILDEDPLSHERLDSGMDTTWEDAGGRFTVGHGARDRRAARGGHRARPTSSSPPPTATTPTSTIAQIASKQFGVPKVIVRVMDPARAEWYAEQGMHTICPTRYAIEMFERALEA